MVPVLTGSRVPLRCGSIVPLRIFLVKNIIYVWPVEPLLLPINVAGLLEFIEKLTHPPVRTPEVYGKLSLGWEAKIILPCIAEQYSIRHLCPVGEFIVQ